MEKLENVLVSAQDELIMGNRYYLYKSREEDERGRKIIGGAYILQRAIEGEPPEKMQLTLEWI